METTYNASAGGPRATVHAGCCDSATSPRAGLSRLINAKIAVAAVLGLMVGLAALASDAAPGASAAPAAPVAPSATATPRLAPNVDESHARAARQLVHNWLLSADPRAAAASRPASPIWVSDLSAVKVTLRHAGWTLGSGQASVTPLTMDVGAATAPADRVVDLVPLLRRAARDAFAASEHAGPGENATPLTELAPTMQIDLQLARSLQQIVITGPDADEVYRRFAPGFHGLVMVGSPAGVERRTAWLWPASALAANVQPPSQVTQMLVELGYPPVNPPRELVGKPGKPGGVTLARFEVIHLTDVGKSTTLLVRGNRVLPPEGVSGATVESIAARVAAHLVHRQGKDLGGALAGTFNPTSDRFDPPDAPPQDLALAAYALGNRAAYLTALRGSDKDVSPLDTEIASLKLASVRVTDFLNKGRGAIGPEAAALVLMTACEAPSMEHLKDVRADYAARLIALQTEDGVFHVSNLQNAAAMEDSHQALLTTALSSYYEQTRDEAAQKAMTRARAVFWSRASATRLQASLPWSAMTEMRMNRLAPGSALEHAKELRALAEALQGRQVKEPPRQGPADVVGGISLLPLSDDAPPIPNCFTTAPPLVFLSLSLRDAEVTPADAKLGRLIACGLAARFLGQLMFDDPSCYYVRAYYAEPEQILGGVRPALWDNRLGLPPSAMTLIALTELERATR